MRRNVKKGFLLVLALICIFSFQVSPVYADADGTELQVTQPEQLEIQLGAEWAAVEFQMKTDAGLYPGSIPVDQDGVLRLEIGGSKSYVLSCMNSSVTPPRPMQVPATTASSEERIASSTDSATVGIPILHLCLFVGGMLLAIGCLVTMYVVKKHRKDAVDYEYNEEDEACTD